MVWVLVAAFSASVTAVSSMSPAVFLVLKKKDTRTTFLASGLGSNARVGSSGPGALGGVVAVVSLCAILCD